MKDLSKIKAAIDEKNEDDLRAELLNIQGERMAVTLLSKLLVEDWHDSHEDIVFELGLLGDPFAIDSIVKAISIPFSSLVKWNNLEEFQRKCAFALARIGTVESRQALEFLSNSTDPFIHKYACEGLRNWPCKYNGYE